MSEEAIRDLADAAEPWTPGPEAKPLPLSRGSDIEIAERVINDVETRHGAVIFCDGDFWRYDKTHWRAIGWATRAATNMHVSTATRQILIMWS